MTLRAQLSLSCIRHVRLSRAHIFRTCLGEPVVWFFLRGPIFFQASMAERMILKTTLSQWARQPTSHVFCLFVCFWCLPYVHSARRSSIMRRQPRGKQVTAYWSTRLALHSLLYPTVYFYRNRWRMQVNRLRPVPYFPDMSGGEPVSEFFGRGPIFSGHCSWNIWWWFLKLSPITCCLAPRARASQMTIPLLTGGPQPRKSGWSIVEMSNNGHTRNFAHSENTFCSVLPKFGRN